MGGGTGKGGALMNEADEIVEPRQNSRTAESRLKRFFTQPIGTPQKTRDCFLYHPNKFLAKVILQPGYQTLAAVHLPKSLRNRTPLIIGSVVSDCMRTAMYSALTYGLANKLGEYFAQ